MTPQEFKAWFIGYSENIEEIPTAKQWARIQSRVKEIDGIVTSYPVYIDRYQPAYWPRYYPAYSNNSIGSIVPLFGNGNGGEWSSNSGIGSLCAFTEPKISSDQITANNFSVEAAMFTTGRFDAQADQS